MPAVKQDRPRMHNRTPGLTTTEGVAGNGERPVVEVRVNYIASALREAGLVVPIDSLVPDPENARQHPERNLEAVKESLCLYSQVEPLVVRAENRMIAAGNGRREAMLALGWTECAVMIQPMTDAEFHGFALADNRTAELAKWDFQTVSRLQKLLADTGHGGTGWTNDELEVLRMADWTPPSIQDIDFSNGGKGKPIEVSFQQRELFDSVVERVRKLREDKKLEPGACLEVICQEWLETQDAQG